MQDNLEFLQWTKRYWDQHYPGLEYDPVARRKASGAPSAAGAGVRSTTPASARASTASTVTSATRRPPAANSSTARAPRPIGGAAGGANVAQTAALKQENDQLKETVEGLERERDFYFNKLRDIELLLQEALEKQPELEQEEDGIAPKIQAILYSTEEGFEIPAEGAEGEVVAGDAVAEEETF